MVKYFFIVLFSAMILCANVIYSQDEEPAGYEKNIISLNLLEFYNFTAELSYQRMIFENQSVYLSFAYTRKDSYYFPRLGSKFEFQYRLGFNQSHKIQYFIGPFISFSAITANISQVPISRIFGYDASLSEFYVKSTFTGAILGTSITFFEQLNLELYSGLGVKFSSLQYNLIKPNERTLYDIGYQNGLGIHYGFNIGYKF